MWFGRVAGQVDHSVSETVRWDDMVYTYLGIARAKALIRLCRS